MAIRKCKTCCSNAACGVVLAEPCVGCGGVKLRECFGGAQWRKKEGERADCASGPNLLERADNRRGKRAARDKMPGLKQVSETPPRSIPTDGRDAGPPGSRAVSLHRSRTQEEEVENADGEGLPRSTAELAGTTEPLAADVPGSGGCLFHAPAPEGRRLDGRLRPANAADLVR